jgi:hypothetical protein
MEHRAVGVYKLSTLLLSEAMFPQPLRKLCPRAIVVLSEMVLDEVKEVTDFSTSARTGALTSVNMGD